MNSACRRTVRKDEVAAAATAYIAAGRSHRWPARTAADASAWTGDPVRSIIPPTPVFLKTFVLYDAIHR
jgi:hypothetical protein